MQLGVTCRTLLHNYQWWQQLKRLTEQCYKLGQLKLSWIANESNQEVVAFLYQLGTDGVSPTPSSLWLPLCFWEMKMDNAISNCQIISLL